MIKIAVVILNYNGRDYLKQFLPSIIEHAEESEIIIADNASTDDSSQLLKNEFPQIRTIDLKKNHGYAGGYNEALKQVEAKYYVLLNSDVEVTGGWLKPLEEFLDINEGYAACQPKIKDFNHRAKFEYAGACGGFIDALGYPYCRGRIFDELEIDSGQYNEPLDIFWASGACMMIRSSAFHQAGGFDEDFFAHMEEIDLCWRLHSAGYQIKSIPSSVVYHVGGGTLSKISPFKTYLNFRNGLSLLIKNLPSNSLIYKLPFRILLDWIASIKFIVEGSPNHAWAVLRAHYGALSRLSRNIRSRKRTSPANNYRLLIIDYFLKKKKRFSEL